MQDFTDFYEFRAAALLKTGDARRVHVMGVESEIIKLSERWGADTHTCRVAALLHDVTKCLAPEEQLQLCEKYGIIVGMEEKADPGLLHSATGAEVARSVFGASEEVCEAIRCHTTGKPYMNLLEKLLYLSDYIEPSRSFDKVHEVRSLAYVNLDDCLLLGFDLEIKLNIKKGRVIHPATLHARNALLFERKGIRS